MGSYVQNRWNSADYNFLQNKSAVGIWHHKAPSLSWFNDHWYIRSGRSLIYCYIFDGRANQIIFKITVKVANFLAYIRADKLNNKWEKEERDPGNWLFMRIRKLFVSFWVQSFNFHLLSWYFAHEGLRRKIFWTFWINNGSKVSQVLPLHPLLWW